jgi:hypothetical protein
MLVEEMEVAAVAFHSCGLQSHKSLSSLLTLVVVEALKVVGRSKMRRFVPVGGNQAMGVDCSGRRRTSGLLSLLS